MISEKQAAIVTTALMKWFAIVTENCVTAGVEPILDVWKNEAVRPWLQLQRHLLAIAVDEKKTRKQAIDKSTSGNIV